MDNVIEKNFEGNIRMKFNIKISNAISSLDNECLKMRDMSKLLTTQGQLESAKNIHDLKKQYYSLLHHTYRYLYELGRIRVTGFYRQKFISVKKDVKVIQRLYGLEFNENKYYTIINFSDKKFTNKNCLGKIDGLFEVRNNEMFTCNEAVRILTNLTRCHYDADTNTYCIPSHLYRGLIKYYSI